MIYAFGDIELDERLFELRRGGVVVHAEPKVLDLLFVLAKAGDRILPREEVQAQVWRDVSVGEASIARAIIEARRAIGDEEHKKIIVTVRGRGLRLALPVTLKRDAPGASPPHEAPASEALPRLSPLPGRAACLSAAAVALERARAGAGSLLWLVGERGIGKSAVLQEIARQAAARGATVRMAHARHGLEAPPFWVWRAAFPELDPAFPALDAQAPAGAARFSLLEAIGRRLMEMASKNPIVVLFDDLHWADPDSLQLLEFLAPEVGRARVVVVATYWHAALGSEEPAQSLVRATGHARSQVMALRPLSRAEIAQVVEGATGASPSDGFVDALFERCGGNPLYLLRVLATEWGHKFSGTPAGQPPPTTMDLPRDVVEVVSEHLSQMSRPGVELLTRAAVLGRRFDLTKLGIVSGLQTRELLAQLDEAVRAQVLRRDPDGSLHFAHRLVRDVLYQRLSSSERSRLHAAVALDLLAHYGKAHERHLKELADHFARALPEGDVERTIELAMRAAEEEARAGRPLQATAYWGSAARALAMIPGGDPRQLEVAVGLAHAWQAAGRDKEAREALVDVKILERAFGKSS